MKIVDRIAVEELKKMADAMYGTFVKAVVDIEKEILAVDAEMHVDLEQILLEGGSKQNQLWGINLHPGSYGEDDFVEFDSMINIRPRQKNMSRSVDNPDTREKIKSIVLEKVNG